MGLSLARQETIPVIGSLGSLTPLQLLIVGELADRKLWNEYVDRYHYLGYSHPIGSHLRY
ncbi:MAG: DUF4338 domain-containing protein, partial [Alteromonas sp.]|nr:DUF4338 domain-containing protein [Alteromonas sp.]